MFQNETSGGTIRNTHENRQQKRRANKKKKDFANFETAHRSQNFPERYNIQLILVIKTDI